MNVDHHDLVAGRVEAGAEWLDANFPGWVEDFNLATFSISSPCQCVLGQVAADIADDLDHLSIRDGYSVIVPTSISLRLAEVVPPKVPTLDISEARSLGFEHDRLAGIGYDDLQPAWVNLIEERRRAVTAS